MCFLPQLALQTDPDMKKRIPASTEASSDDIKHDLVVLEVMLDLPRIRLTKPATAGAAGDRAAPKRVTKISGTKKTPDDTARGSEWQSSATRKFTAELHRVVGVYTTSEENCPSGLDLNFFDWETFQRIGRERSMDHIYDQPSGPTADETLNADVTDRQGVMTAERFISKERTFLFKFLARTFNREDLNKKLPKKVRIWVGLE